MDIQKLDIKKKLAAGTALAVLSGFVPPLVNSVNAGTANVPIDVDIVTAINLATTTGLDFGRLAITGVIAPTNHTLSPGGVTTTGANLSVALAGSPGNFQITAGTGANNVNVLYTNTVSYNGGNIILDQVTLTGNGIVGTITVGNGATVTGNLAGGGNQNVNVGGRLAIGAGLTNGNFTAQNATIQIVDIP
ncbi:MAG: DUF4402 domain-containing protein [Pseudomonadota bacterium]